MEIKIVYYPILDMILAIRQAYSVERFKPFTGLMESILLKLPEKEKLAVNRIGDATEGWLAVLERMIELSKQGLVSPEEFLLAIEKKPEIITSEKITKETASNLSELLRRLWQGSFGNEISKHTRTIFEKSRSISEVLEEKGLMRYLTELTDRLEKLDETTLRMHIKPEHLINVDQIQSALFMPSIFASRRLTFWYNGLDYLFYISMESFGYENIEPSDMLLLKTLAFNDRTRLKMLKLLTKGNYTTNEMAEKLNMNASTVSRHFKVFKDTGFVDIYSQEGNTIYYSLNPEEIKKSFKDILDYIV